MQEIQNAREPSNGTAGTIPPAQEKEGYVADLDEWWSKLDGLGTSAFDHYLFLESKQRPKSDWSCSRCLHLCSGFADSKMGGERPISGWAGCCSNSQAHWSNRIVGNAVHWEIFTALHYTSECLRQHLWIPHWHHAKRAVKKSSSALLLTCIAATTLTVSQWSLE